jgi:hypothetical protein
MRKSGRALKMVEPPSEDGRLSYTVSGFAAATGLGKSSIFKAIAAYRRGDPDGLPVISRKGRTLILRDEGVRWLHAGKKRQGPPTQGNGGCR